MLILTFSYQSAPERTDAYLCENVSNYDCAARHLVERFRMLKSTKLLIELHYLIMNTYVPPFSSVNTMCLCVFVRACVWIDHVI